MSWVTLLWLFVGSACVTLAGIHFLIGLKRPGQYQLWFALLAVSAAAIGACELALMRSVTPAEVGAAVRWAHVPLFTLFVSFVFFVRSYFRAGRPWIGWVTIAVRAVCLLVNFLQSPNLNYRVITGVGRIPFLGDEVSVPIGVVSPWARLGQLGSLLLLAFLIDATATVWRRGERAHAAVVGGSAVLFVISAAGSSALVYTGHYRIPFIISVPFFLIVLVMSYQLTRDVLRASELARSLDLSQQARALAEREAALRRDEVIHLSRVRMLGELSGSLAHELNRPLATILTNAQAAQRLIEHPVENAGELREILADIVEEDRRASDVIQRLRRLMRRGEIHLEPLELSHVVEEAVGLARSDLVARGIAASSKIPDGLPLVRGDRIQIEQVLLNLFTNACDAMHRTDPDRRQMVVRLGHGDNGSVTVSVADRGPGIPPGELERVFEPFVTTKETGMGLGLTVCQTIVRAHGGRLWAENNPDGGATFSFTLPIVRPEAS